MARIRLETAEIRPGALPLVCMACGRPAVTHVSKSFTWRPPGVVTAFWISLFVCLPLLPIFLIVGIMQTKSKTLDGPMCERHRHYWGWRGFWFSAPLLVLLIAVVTLGVLLMQKLVPDDVFGLLFVGTAVLLLAWAVTAALMQRNSIRAGEITGDSLTLEAVHSDFVDAVQALRRPAKRTEATVPAWEQWDRYDPYPRSQSKGG